MKHCPKCKSTKPLSEYGLATNGPQGRHSYCKLCRKALRDNTAPYEISRLEYDKILHDQGGVCKLCLGSQVGRWDKLDIDHDHVTGKVRGLLCGNCNRGLGLLKDSPELLRRAADYLAEEH